MRAQTKDCPRRIVSLVPSLTETVVQLGLRSELVGCTSFCVEPPTLHRELTVIGGTKDSDVERILALSPTHILANQEENTRELVLQLMERVPTLVTFPRSPVDVPAMLRSMGTFLECSEAADAMATDIEMALQELARTPQASGASDAASVGRRFLYLIWRAPYMVAGADTYISRLLECAGWRNAFDGEVRYPALSISEIKALAPDQIFLASEPFAFRNRHIEMMRAEDITLPRISKIDGRIMSWFGWKTLEALHYVRSLGV
jgi:iron complex transport system substrate-binding protein